MNLFAKLPFKKGFTLLELLVVIAILGILLSIGFVFYQRALQNARDQTRLSDLSNVKIALEQYFADDNFVYPTSNAGRINCGGPDLDWGTSSLDCGGFIYMKVLPRDPSGSPEYCYVATGSPPNEFIIHAQMENSNNSNGGPITCSGPSYNYRVQSER